MQRRLLRFVFAMTFAVAMASACEMDVRTICDDSMDYRIEAYNTWTDDYNGSIEAGEPECKKVTREKEKKPWPKSAYNFYETLMADYCVAEPTSCQLDPGYTGGIDASKSAIQDCFGDLLRDAEECYTHSVNCQDNLTDYLEDPNVECFTLGD